MKPQPPQFLNDLYRDLRDRRLIIPVVGLLVAIAAVPFVLGGGGDEVPPPIAQPLPEGAEAVQPAVLVDNGGIRDYRKRLAALKEKNPFGQRYGVPKAEDVGVESPVDPTVETAGSIDAGDPLPTNVFDPPASGSTPDTTVPFGGEPSTPSPDPAVDTEPADEPADEPKPEVRFYVGRVDISFGQPGHGKQYKDVRELDFIPNDKQLMVGFIGLAGNGEHAVFSLSPNVVETSGDGSCAPKKPDPCQFVRLGEGESRRLEFANGRTFVLRLLETQLVRIPDPRDQK